MAVDVSALVVAGEYCQAVIGSGDPVDVVKYALAGNAVGEPTGIVAVFLLGEADVSAERLVCDPS